MSRSEIQLALRLKGQANLRNRYLLPAVRSGLIKMTIPDKPNSRMQRYAIRSSICIANLGQFSCLDYRHTFGSQLAMKGESLYKISALMGNSPEICRRHYAALLPESLVECVEFPSATGV